MVEYVRLPPYLRIVWRICPAVCYTNISLIVLMGRRIFTWIMINPNWFI